MPQLRHVLVAPFCGLCLCLTLLVCPGAAAAPTPEPSTGAPAPTLRDVEFAQIAITDHWSREATSYQVHNTAQRTLLVADHLRSRGFDTVLRLAKCAASITLALASTVLVITKIVKIKRLLSAAGGLRRTAQRSIRAFKTPGTLHTKARAGFQDLGKGAVAAAVLLLDLDMIARNCR